LPLTENGKKSCNFDSIARFLDSAVGCCSVNKTHFTPL